MEVSAMVMGLLGGLAIFLYGMEIMTEALKTVAGSGLRSLLSTLTHNRFTGALAGALVTATIQSSSVTTVLVVGFITANLMTLSQSVGVIMGANIGTTITAQIIAFKVTQYALLLVAVGFVVWFTARRQRSRQIGAMILGLGMIFFGMELMSEATGPLRSYRPFIDLMGQMRSPLPAVLIGGLFTALVQSSSATSGIVIVLATQGFITLETGIALIFGANIGTCVTAILASIGKPRAAVQAAAVHVLFNLAGVLLWLGFIDPLAEVTRLISPAAVGLEGTARLAVETPRQIANAHSLFNLANTVLFIGFSHQIARLTEWLVPVRVTSPAARIQPRFLDTTALATPDIALNYVHMELERLGGAVRRMLESALPVVLHGGQEELNHLVAMDEDVDILHGAIVAYLGRLAQGNLLSEQSRLLNNYLAVANYMENIGDMVETNFAESGQARLQADVHFSQETRRAIQELYGKIQWSVEAAMEAVIQGDRPLAHTVIDAKPEINRLSDALDSHLALRLTAREPNRMELFRIESDIIENFRRIYYFAKRIAKITTGTEKERSLAPTAAD